MFRAMALAAVLLSATFGGPTAAQTPQSGDALASPRPASRPSRIDPVKIILVGDSTTSQQTGWGGAFCDLHVIDLVACLPMGRGGRSTKTYRAEGTWDLVLNELKVPGYAARYVLIEMGHNDKSAVPAIGTERTTEFPGNLDRFVGEVMALGGIPILVTPLATRHFKGGRNADSLIPWAEQVRLVAGRTNTVVVDLGRMSSTLFEQLGASGALKLEGRPVSAEEVRAAEAGTTLPARVPSAAPVTSSEPADDPRRNYGADYIHLNRAGAEQISALVAGALRTQVPKLRAFVVR